MRSQQAPGRRVVSLGNLAGCLLAVAVAVAHENNLSHALAQAGPDPVACADIPGPCPTLSMKQLVHMSGEELEQLYLHAEPGPIPEGFAQGRAIRWPGTVLAGPMSGIYHLVWHGKIFHCEDGTLVNQWCCGVKTIRAQVCYGPSWIDGRPSIIMDYSATSRVWSDVRDEVRQICPGLYLGVMFLRKCPQPQFKMYFALETPPHCE